jgi:hypothetical protein
LLRYKEDGKMLLLLQLLLLQLLLLQLLLLQLLLLQLLLLQLLQLLQLHTPSGTLHWQLVIEMVKGISILIYVRVFIKLKQNMFLDCLLIIFISAIHFVVLPAFFLLADQSFRNSARIHGGFKALWMLFRN